MDPICNNSNNYNIRTIQGDNMINKRLTKDKLCQIYNSANRIVEKGYMKGCFPYAEVALAVEGLKEKIEENTGQHNELMFKKIDLFEYIDEYFEAVTKK